MVSVPLGLYLCPSVTCIRYLPWYCLVVDRDVRVVDLLGQDGFLQIIARRARAVKHIFGIIAKEVLIRQDHRDYRLAVVNVRLKGYVTPIFALFYALVSLIEGRVILVRGLLRHPELFSYCFMRSPT